MRYVIGSVANSSPLFAGIVGQLAVLPRWQCETP